jgi:hypothetical protein
VTRSLVHRGRCALHALKCCSLQTMRQRQRQRHPLGRTRLGRLETGPAVVRRYAVSFDFPLQLDQPCCACPCLSAPASPRFRRPPPNPRSRQAACPRAAASVPTCGYRPSQHTRTSLALATHSLISLVIKRHCSFLSNLAAVRVTVLCQHNRPILSARSGLSNPWRVLRRDELHRKYRGRGLQLVGGRLNKIGQRSWNRT